MIAKYEHTDLPWWMETIEVDGVRVSPAYFDEPEELDHFWFSFPPDYRKAYATIRLYNLSCINWNGWVSVSSRKLCPELGSLRKLQSLHLGSTRLVSIIPLELSQLWRLTYLNLSKNALSGPIPPQLGNLINLTHLILAENELSGSIPVELGNIVKLKYLALNSNQLSGDIPDMFGNWIHLLIMSLENNRLTGSIPSSIGLLSSLAIFNASRNQLVGPIPPELVNATGLMKLNLSNNKFNQTIPNFLASFQLLTVLDLHKNEFTGGIPDAFATLALQELDLSSNHLSGPISHRIALNFQLLSSLNLSKNQFSGPFPHQIWNSQFLRYVCLSYNKFDTFVMDPQRVMNRMVNLSELDLQNLAITGTLPFTLLQLPRLRKLMLYGTGVNRFVHWSFTEMKFWSSLEEAGFFGIDHDNLIN
ncbi:L domain-like protein [Rhizoclosmatium globosum]|uniref:L domain-like protein n=1 Tax=Rhizoclosmatium globosum TaxID=329046 RepID=A0A1Y2B741_9FUNG|nr:L domain-like protein [Rhizoclosmatium globosum]|eukprot:ORY30658.1 L domain-like protein [Rhizoclosmatium globosum]